MTPTITSTQRDLLYDGILDRLSGIGDLWLAVEKEDYAAAQRMGVAYSDRLRLIVEDLGWGDGSGEPVELRTAVDVLRRALSRLHEETRDRDAGEERERVELQENEERNRLVMETCRNVIAELGDEPAA